MKIKFLIIFLLLFSYAELKAQTIISGALRNDAALIVYEDREDDKSFNDILENKLVLRYRSDLWKFYGDGRLYLYYGDISDIRKYDIVLMRSFIRYSPGIGDFTLGKTYINLGTPGLFNPFEFRKQVSITDLTGDKEGMLAFEYDIPIGGLSGCKVFAGTYDSGPDLFTGDTERHNTGGISLRTNITTFDIGAVAFRKRDNMNTAGLYFKGDLLLGIQGAYAYHFYDDGKRSNVEANFGLDYSFFNTKVIISAVAYYNKNGAGNKNEYPIFPDPDVYFRAMWYGFGNIMFKIDEFLNIEIGGFVNPIDNSGILYPAVQYVLADGLSIKGMAYFFTGKEDQEFTRDLAGVFNGLIRVEAKF